MSSSAAMARVAASRAARRSARPWIAARDQAASTATSTIRTTDVTLALCGSVQEQATEHLVARVEPSSNRARFPRAASSGHARQGAGPDDERGAAGARRPRGSPPRAPATPTMPSSRARHAGADARAVGFRLPSLERLEGREQRSGSAAIDPPWSPAGAAGAAGAVRRDRIARWPSRVIGRSLPARRTPAGRRARCLRAIGPFAAPAHPALDHSPIPHPAFPQECPRPWTAPTAPRPPRPRLRSSRTAPPSRRAPSRAAASSASPAAGGA